MWNRPATSSTRSTQPSTVFSGNSTRYAVLNQEPWEDYCVQPPCGQFNPVNPALYSVLGELTRYAVLNQEPWED